MITTGNIDRKKIGNIVFSQKDKMQVFTELTWGYMKKQLDNILSSCNDNFIILEWILLPDSEYWSKCDFKILVTADSIKRKEFVLKRDNISEEYFEKRDSASIDYSPFNFDYVFENDYQKLIMDNAIEAITDKYLL